MSPNKGQGCPLTISPEGLIMVGKKGEFSVDAVCRTNDLGIVTVAGYE